jgi:hypothetical protein
MAENKIIVDEDWKAQVQAEKEAAVRQAPSSASPAGAAASPKVPHADEAQALPPATLSSLIFMLANQATMALSGFPDPDTGQAQVHLPLARHMIDMLEVIEQKTHGNRTPEEISLLSRTLHELRMAYVAVEQEVKNQPR